jgi:hypothetical protein
MSVSVLDSRGRRSGLPGKKAGVYTVGKYGGMRVTNDPIGLVVYSSGVQYPASGSWQYAFFDAAIFPPASYGLPVMWAASPIPHIVQVLESGWYFLSASIQFQAVNSVDLFPKFRFYVMGSGLSLPGGDTYVPNQYSFPISGDVVYYFNAGDRINLQVYHTYSPYLALNGGLVGCSMSIGRIGS